MPVGHVISLTPQKGFGFIRPEGAEDDLFFHKSVVNCRLESLEIGQEVEYQVDEDADRPRAKSVRARDVSKAEPSRSSDGPRPSRRPRRDPAIPTECGFVTKLWRKTHQGFISADTGGAELLFDESDVVGDKRFYQIAIGDYVRFVRNPKLATASAQEPATAVRVEVIERVPKRLPRLELPSNPKARRKKPTWR